ncbi:MAG: hypothetical protein JWN40_1762 [Phycisphaerales bacterium]|nr:hypothetical protein [Phycisphaerales bacterium]
MLRVTRSLFCVAFALVACASVGCQSTSMSKGSERSVIAGKTTFVEVTGGQGSPQMVAYTAPGATVCPECKTVASDYFKSGALSERVCKSCGATINVGQGQIVSP